MLQEPSPHESEPRIPRRSPAPTPPKGGATPSPAPRANPGSWDEARGDLPVYPGSPAREPHPRPEEIERELERVHRRRCAERLRAAAGVVAGRAPQHGLWSHFPVPREGLRSFRRRAQEVVQAAAAGDFAPAARAWLEHLIRSEPADWPPALRLVRLARRWHEGEWARICIGFAWLGEGRADPAARIFSALLLHGDLLRHRWRVLEGLALAHALGGRRRLALAAIDSAADEPDCGVSTLAEGLHQALLEGDPHLVRRAAARIDLLVDVGSPALASALATLRRRRAAGLVPAQRRRAGGAAERGAGAELRLLTEAPSGSVAQVTTDP